MADPGSPANDPGASQSGPMPVLYQEPRPLNAENFGKSGLRRGGTLGFAAKTNAVPLSISEFQFAHKNYPIVFGGDPPMPIAVLGFVQNENLFVSSDGNWADDNYIPGYIRRYPFILAEVPGQDRLFLCADAKADMITDKSPELPFFSEGKPNEVINQALNVCKQFQEDIVLTRAFCAELQSHNLLKPTDLRFNLPDGTQRNAGTFVSIDSAALDALPDQVFLDFRKRSMLPIIYMQQSSLANWSRLAMRREKLLAVKTN